MQRKHVNKISPDENFSPIPISELIIAIKPKAVLKDELGETHMHSYQSPSPYIDFFY
jgi:hypothetical protein